MPGAARVTPAAQDEPLDPRVAREAAHWLMRLHPAAEPDDAERRACLAWRASHAQHELAWQRAQQFNKKFTVMPAELGKAALGRPAARQRRQAVKTLAVLLTAAPAGILAYQHLPVAAWGAAYRTATGERRSVQLADGSRVQMNTGTAFDVVVDDTQRLVLLHEGELVIQTAPDARAAPRPFRVRTADGLIRAIGTRFCVRCGSDWSEVGVFEGAVEVTVGAAGQRVVAANEQLRFSPRGRPAPKRWQRTVPIGWTASCTPTTRRWRPSRPSWGVTGAAGCAAIRPWPGCAFPAASSSTTPTRSCAPWPPRCPSGLSITRVTWRRSFPPEFF